MSNNIVPINQKRVVFSADEREAVVALLKTHREELAATNCNQAFNCQNGCWNCDEFKEFFSDRQFAEVQRIWDSMNLAESQGHDLNEHVVYDMRDRFAQK